MRSARRNKQIGTEVGREDRCALIEGLWEGSREAVDLCIWAGQDLWRLGESTPGKGSSVLRAVERRPIIARLGKGRIVSGRSTGARGCNQMTEHHEQLLWWDLGSVQWTMESSQESVNKKWSTRSEAVGFRMEGGFEGQREIFGGEEPVWKLSVWVRGPERGGTLARTISTQRRGYRGTAITCTADCTWQQIRWEKQGNKGDSFCFNDVY